MRPLCLPVALCLLYALVVADQTLAAAPAIAGFDLFEFAVEGNTVLPAVEIERAVYPWLGPGKTAADIEKARAALEAMYQDSGYLSVSVVVPEQSVADGVVRLQVVEGQVERLKVSGNRFTSRNELRAQVPELAPGQVPYFPAMQVELAEAGRSPDRRVTPLLRPGRRPGTMEVELAVEDDLPFHGNIEINNRESPDTTDRRLEVGIRYDNLFQKQHSAGLNYVVSPENTSEINVLAGFYNAPLGGGRSVSMFAQYSNSDITTALDGAALGKGTTLGARYSWTLPNPVGIGGFFHSLSAGLDYKDLTNTQSLLGIDDEKPLRYTPLMAQYTAAQFGESGEFTGNLALVANFGVSKRYINCGGIELDQFECSRAGARSSFALLRGDLGYSHRLLGWEVMARLDFQAGGQPLVAQEQMLSGGMDSVRGYLEGETAGDAGWRLKAEVKTPTLFEVGRSALRALVFLEGSELWLNDPLPRQTSEFKLAGAGLGLRLKGVKGSPLVVLDLAHALKAGPRTANGDQRMHLRLGYEF